MDSTGVPTPDMGALWFFFWNAADWAAVVAGPPVGSLALMGVGRVIVFAFVSAKILGLT